MLMVSVFGFILVGCSSNSNNQPTTQNEDVLSMNPNVEDFGSEITDIVMTFQTLSISRNEDLDKVIEAINAITIPEIQVRLSLKLVDAVDAFTDYSLWISQGEVIDLMILNYQDITDYINRNMILPLDNLLQSQGQDILAIQNEGASIFEGSVIQDEIYGVSNLQDVYASGGGLWVARSLLEEANTPIEENKVYTMSELEDLFAKWKDIHPNAYPLGQITVGNTYSTYGYYRSPLYGLGTDPLYGVLRGDQVVNFFETDEYKEFLNYLRSWYLKGYIFPDAAFTDSDLYELIRLGILLSVPLSSQPGLISEDIFGEEVLSIKTSPVVIGKPTSKSGFWTIPVTSKNPEAAMKFLNMMMSDTRIGNLLKWGIEGLHYVKTDERRIEYPVGVDQQTCGFFNPMNLYGDYRKIATMDDDRLIEEKKEYNSLAVESEYQEYNFTYTNQKMKKEFAAVEKVIEKYVPILESGSVDLDIYYSKFLEELEFAGLQQILQDKQEQFDQWKEGEGK